MAQEKSLRAIFNEALARETALERARYLDEACGADSHLRQRVEALLQAHDNAGGFLSQPNQILPGATAPGPAPPSWREQTGDRIGRYKLFQQLGEGGGGVVYLAEQEEPVRRRVALKIIRLGMDTKQVVIRFEAERQALALMDHPGIAKVLDGGATDSGRPFFVMELVSGVRITEFCDEKKLSTRERLQLFVNVCAAIQHAHQKGIIHRDVKPSNILVTMVDGVPHPKVIDFGIAKATTNQRLTDKTLFTAFEQFIGTPAYMSPEQAEASGVDIDTRTDIYSLGVILYELLTGRTPFDTHELLQSGIDEIRRTIREREPSRPSTRLSALRLHEATTVAAARKTEPLSLVRLVRGDLDWVVMKCLEKDRNRRYATANDLAADIKRHLDNEPVLARPPNSLYRLQKLVTRHRAVSFLSVILLLSLFAGAGMLWRSDRQLRRALRAEKELRAVEVEALRSSLVSQARAQRLSHRLGQRLDVLATLERAAKIRPTLDARDEAAAALALPDFRPLAEWPAYFVKDDATMAFNAELDTYATGAPDGGFVLYAVSDRRELRRFPGENSRVVHLTFSPDSRRLAVLLENGTAQVWRLDADAPEFTWPRGKWPVALDFSPDGTELVVAWRDGVFVQPLPGGASSTNQPFGDFGSPAKQIQFVRFDPAGKRLAIVRGETIEVWSYVERSRLWSAPLPKPTGDLTWSPDGRLLAAASNDDRAIPLFDAATGRVTTSLRGHQGSPRHLRFHPDGRRLVSTGWDRTLRLWDTRTGHELLNQSASPRTLRFSRDGQRLAYSPGYATVGFLEVAPETVFREFRSAAPISETAYGVNVSPDGRFVVTTSLRGLRIYDAQTASEIFFLPLQNLWWNRCFFSPDGKKVVLTIILKGVVEFAFNWHEDTSNGVPVVELGPLRQIGSKTNAVLDSVGYDGVPGW